MKEYKYRRRPVWRKRKSDVIAEAIMEISVGIILVSFWVYFWIAPWGA